MLNAIMYFSSCKSNKKLIGRADINFNSRIYNKIRNEYAKIQSKNMIGKFAGSRNPMFGRKRTPEEKAKIRKTRLERGCGLGPKNSMYGRPCTYKMT